jgi:thioester reductase-like protein
MKKNILITGATGFLGSFLIKELLDKGYRIFALARSRNGLSAKQRVFNALKFVYENDWNQDSINLNLEVIEGDIIYPDLGIKNSKQKERTELETDIIIHSAALAELNLPLDVIRRINVEGTKNVLNFALKCKAKGRLYKVNYISTAYVVGNKDIEFDETMLDVGQGFNNTYEQSKFEAELLVREYLKKGLGISVFRPSMIMGHSKTGKTNNFKLFYQPLHFFCNEIFYKFPGNLLCSQNLINIDIVALAISLLFESNDNFVYHIVSLSDIKVEYFMELASDFFGFKIPRFIPIEKFDLNWLSPVQKKIVKPFIPYFNYKTKFVSNFTYARLNTYNFQNFEIDKINIMRVFEYCIKAGFINKHIKRKYYVSQKNKS